MSKETENNIERIRRLAEEAISEFGSERGHKVLVQFKSDFGLPEEDGVEYQIESNVKTLGDTVYPEFTVSRSEDGGPFQKIGKGVDIDVALERAVMKLENSSSMALGR
ncbi:hypothetical protein [Sulfitobacter sp. R18_1]|uniref:hypothetical protein n=1 Tax=Sulfitobacter sp. R18_1 TaxID=2821104 RepID=UPI001ADC308D|nr:hypothetical protein [Sulfitobacter sp. R18_1]MBO9428439.1 hypothetical protein [Sulfitobacter sp. R18_1]